VLLAIVAATVALSFSMASGPVSQAHAEEFCGRVWLQSYGDYWGRDRCNSNTWIWPAYVVVQTYERAGCVDAMDPNFQLFTNWACTGPNDVKQILMDQGHRAGVGIIRNNNLSNPAFFSGNQTSWPSDH
jgi:hypothetical protein